MRFIDSNVLVSAFYKNDNLEACQEIIRKGGVTNTLVLAESFHVLERITKDKERAKKAIRALLRSNIEIIDLNINIFFESVKRIDSFNLKIFDMIHYISAKMSGCASIISYDKDFDNTDLKRKEPG